MIIPFLDLIYVKSTQIVVSLATMILFDSYQ